MKKLMIAILFIALTIVLFSGCSSLDVVGDGSAVTFEAILGHLGSARTTYDDAGYWVITAPDGDTRLILSDHFEGKSGDVAMDFDAEPFIAAGLNMSAMPEELTQGDRIQIGMHGLADLEGNSGKSTPVDAYRKILKAQPDRISYHAGMGHYKLMVADGGDFKWARDAFNHKSDMVFALNPAVFIAAGLNPEKVVGWNYITVEDMETDGRTVSKKILTKAFNLV